MKRVKYLLSFVLTLCLLCSLSTPAFAATTYTVRLFDTQNNLRFRQTYNYGQRVDLPVNMRETSGKYYVKGAHLAGQDNDDLAELSFAATEDADYVLSYGFAGNMVAYTVRYVVAETGEHLYPDDGYGNRLNWEEVYYGAIGDKIVVPSRQVVGYLPQAYNLTKTLSANEGANLFVFEYTPETALAPAPEAAEEGGVVTDQAPNVVIPDGGVPAANQPQEIIDLDEEDTPLGLLDLGKDAAESGAQLLNALPFGARIGLIGLDLVVIGLIVWGIVYGTKKRKEQKEQKEQTT